MLSYYAVYFLLVQYLVLHSTPLFLTLGLKTLMMAAEVLPQFELVLLSTSTGQAPTTFRRFRLGISESLARPQ